MRKRVARPLLKKC